MIASAPAEHYRQAIEIVGADENIDSLIVIFTPPLVTRAEDVGKAIVEASQHLDNDKPLLSVFLSAQPGPAELRMAEVSIPSYSFPETAAIALARATRYRQWRDRRETYTARFENIRTYEAAAVVAGALARGEGWLTPDEVAKICSCYGLPLVQQRIAGSIDDVAAAAKELGGEVALKAIAPGLVHKTEAGAVKLNLNGHVRHFSRAKAQRRKETLSNAATLCGFAREFFCKRGAFRTDPDSSTHSFPHRWPAHIIQTRELIV